MSNLVISKKVSFNVPSGQELKDLVELSKCLATSPFYGKFGPGGILAIYLTARELNLPFMCCLNGGMYNIEGKVVLSAMLMHQMILNSGHDVKIIESTDKKCILNFIRKGHPKEDNLYEYTVEEAHQAGYFGGVNSKTGEKQRAKDNWVKFTKDMLFNRCLSGGSRKIVPDSFIGPVYVQGELIEDDMSVSTIQAQVHPAGDVSSSSQTDLPPEEPPKLIEQQESGFDEFCSTHGIVEGSEKMAFIQHVSEKGNMTTSRVINGAMKDTKKFLKGFDKWKSEKEAMAV